MRFPHLPIFIVTIFFFFPLNFQAAPQNNVVHRTFWQPCHHGLRVNYCSQDGKICGAPQANLYCHMLGYEKSTDSMIANNVGFSRFLPGCNTCIGWDCNGFKYIDCSKHLDHTPPKPYHYRYRHFYYPRYQHYRVDWCYDGCKGCGARAANSFCRRMGYNRASHFSIAKEIAATSAIGNQKLCFGRHCNAFQEISCYR